MSIYKKDIIHSRVQRLRLLASVHALAVDVNFETLNQSHSIVTCECCLKNGNYFSSLVNQYRTTEVYNYVS